MGGSSALVAAGDEERGLLRDGPGSLRPAEDSDDEEGGTETALLSSRKKQAARQSYDVEVPEEGPTRLCERSLWQKSGAVLLVAGACALVVLAGGDRFRSFPSIHALAFSGKQSKVPPPPPPPGHPPQGLAAEDSGGLLNASAFRRAMRLEAGARTTPKWRKGNAAPGNHSGQGNHSVHMVQGKGSVCLCLFDVDRTLTARQRNPAGKGPAETCKDVQQKHGVRDTAFGGGDLRLSQLSLNLGASGCARCHKGIISAGTVAAKREKEILSRQLGAPHHWSTIDDIQSPMVTSCSDGLKRFCALEVLKYYARHLHVVIDPSDVYLFDDSAVNVESFAHSGMNAHQVSCATRDREVGNGVVGLCGGRSDEVHLQKGISFCE